MNLDPNDPALGQRAAVFAALGDPLRLAIVDQIVLGDRTPAELEKRLGVRSNLLAHHLGILERAGLLRRVASAGDRRCRYLQWLPPSPAALWPSPRIRTRRPLFVCRGNAARSQFAAAYWNRRGGPRADSAGARPAERVHPQALRAAARRGLDLRGAVPQGYDCVSAEPDLVISLCDLAHEADPPFPAARSLHWSVPDPVPADPAGAAPDPAAFDRSFGMIAERIDRLRDALAPEDA